MLVVGYGVARAGAAFCNEFRNAVFAKVLFSFASSGGSDASSCGAGGRAGLAGANWRSWQRSAAQPSTACLHEFQALIAHLVLPLRPALPRPAGDPGRDPQHRQPHVCAPARHGPGLPPAAPDGGGVARHRPRHPRHQLHPQARRPGGGEWACGAGLEPSRGCKWGQWGSASWAMGGRLVLWVVRSWLCMLLWQRLLPGWQRHGRSYHVLLHAHIVVLIVHFQGMSWPLPSTVCSSQTHMCAHTRTPTCAHIHAHSPSPPFAAPWCLTWCPPPLR